ncbi:MAG: hypothetical protein IT514_12505 [Burkholderiales bacterium]|nr:hypothetical protein [Burkholderiales bacterium]
MKALALEGVRSKLAAAGLEVAGGTPQEFAARSREEIVDKGKLVAVSGAKPD